MNPGEHNFLIASSAQSRKLLEDTLRGKTPASPPGLGQDTVTTGSVTPLLDFEDGPAMMKKTVNRMTLEWAVRNHGDLNDRLFSRNERTGERGNLAFRLIAQHRRNPLHSPHRIGEHFSITPRDDDHTTRIRSMSPPHQLAGLVVGLSRNSARVDNIHIRITGKGNLTESTSSQFFPHDLRIKLINLATQRCNRKAFHGTEPPLLPGPRPPPALFDPDKFDVTPSAHGISNDGQNPPNAFDPLSHLQSLFNICPGLDAIAHCRSGGIGQGRIV